LFEAEHYSVNIRDGKHKRRMKQFARSIAGRVPILDRGMTVLLRGTVMLVRSNQGGLSGKTMRTGVLQNKRESKKTKEQPHQFH